MVKFAYGNTKVKTIDMRFLDSFHHSEIAAIVSNIFIIFYEANWFRHSLKKLNY